MAETPPHIPGNEYALEELRGLLGSGRGFAFVGAGASAGLYPLWGELFRQLADEAIKRDLADEKDKSFWLSMFHSRPNHAVHSIKSRLQGVYLQKLRDIFRPRAGADGNFFTPIHGALMRIGFRGYVTTNYDPGLIEARAALRPDSLATGFATWKDTDTIHRWITGDIFQEQPCPILFAHGIYERGDTIVLSADEYREAYAQGPYRRLFDKLWGQERLVFVGFGFGDPWLNFLADGVITETAARAAAQPRHIAIIGLKEGEEYTPDMREQFRNDFNATAIFYRVASPPGGPEDHGDLLRILEGFAGAGAARASRPREAVQQQASPQKWTHETTNDALYVERADALRKLNRWADDPEVRAIALTGLGGLGKTALVGHWLRVSGGDARRYNRGLFFWSFYANRDVAAFFSSFLKFAAAELQIPERLPSQPLVDRALDILEDAPLILVLDGLEVLQGQPGGANYGALHDSDLRKFLERVCRARRRGLAVLTSRFPFIDLDQYLGGGLRLLDLDQLTPAEGAALLARCDVGGTAADREAVSRRLEGHPLGLRIFAETLAAQADSDPTRLCQKVFDQVGLKESDPLERKLSHLLSFYERQLPPQQVALLGIISLFSAPVDAATIKTLSRTLPATHPTLGPLSDSELDSGLQKLRAARLVLYDESEDSQTYSCHPVLRDHFRRALLNSDASAAAYVANFLTEKPSADGSLSFSELEMVVTAAELLVEAGDYRRADDLYSTRLADGYVFLNYPAPDVGMRCALKFVETEAHRRRCEEQLSERRSRFYLNAVGALAAGAGDFHTAASYYEEAVARTRGGDDRTALSLHLNYSELLTARGLLTEAEASAREALSLSRRFKDGPGTPSSLAHLGHVLCLRGRLAEARQHFEEADEIQRSGDQHGRGLYSFRGIKWAEMLLRLGRINEAKHSAEINLEICRRNKWVDCVALCHYVLGRVNIAENRPGPALEHLNTSDSMLRRGHQFIDLPRLLVARAELERLLGRWTDLLHYSGEALSLASTRGMRLAHADALVLRGHALLNQARAELAPGAERFRLAAERAQDDARDALRLAGICNYKWAERDSLTLLAETYEALGDADQHSNLLRQAELLSRRLSPG